MTARIDVRLTPRGGRDRIDGWDGDVLRVRVAAPPAEGRANEAMVRLVAKALGVPPSRVSLVAGAQSRTKVIEIDGLTADEIHARI
ncbi:MAG: DUF167 domain-containing protein [Dehalococcoidia bacterium]|nr:MAG: DUF167 domain-containing protein [Dehalococcoidia bacterium]